MGLIGFRKISDFSYKLCCRFGTSDFLGPTLTAFNIVNTTPGTGSNIRSASSSSTNASLASKIKISIFSFILKGY